MLRSFILFLALGLGSSAFGQGNGQAKSVFGFLNKTTIAPVAAHFYEIKEQHPTLSIEPYKLSLDFELLNEERMENTPVLVNFTGKSTPAPQSGYTYEVSSIELMTLSKTVSGTLSTFVTQGGVQHYLKTNAGPVIDGNEEPQQYTLILNKAAAAKTAELTKDVKSVEVSVTGVAYNGQFAVTDIELQ